LAIYQGHVGVEIKEQRARFLIKGAHGIVVCLFRQIGVAHNHRGHRRFVHALELEVQLLDVAQLDAQAGLGFDDFFV